MASRSYWLRAARVSSLPSASSASISRRQRSASNQGWGLGAAWTMTVRPPNGSASNPASLQERARVLHHRVLGRREAERDGEQQPLAGSAARVEIPHERLEQDPLVGRVLVDDQEAARGSRPGCSCRGPATDGDATRPLLRRRRRPPPRRPLPRRAPRPRGPRGAGRHEERQLARVHGPPTGPRADEDDGAPAAPTGSPESGPDGGGPGVHGGGAVEWTMASRRRPPPRPRRRRGRRTGPRPWTGARSRPRRPRPRPGRGAWTASRPGGTVVR
jgi:hypothetical protein